MLKEITNDFDIPKISLTLKIKMSKLTEKKNKTQIEYCSYFATNAIASDTITEYPEIISIY